MKLTLYKELILPVLCYSAEPWTVEHVLRAVDTINTGFDEKRSAQAFFLTLSKLLRKYGVMGWWIKLKSVSQDACIRKNFFVKQGESITDLHSINA